MSGVLAVKYVCNDCKEVKDTGCLSSIVYVHLEAELAVELPLDMTEKKQAMQQLPTTECVHRQCDAAQVLCSCVGRLACVMSVCTKERVGCLYAMWRREKPNIGT